jgi:hypothetical protein
MEDGCLAVMVPLMIRALRERSAVVQRRSSVIIENMSKLVQDPAEARPFLPQLMPLLDRVANEAADPELREVGAGWLVWWVLVVGLVGAGWVVCGCWWFGLVGAGGLVWWVLVVWFGGCWWFALVGAGWFGGCWLMGAARRQT